MCLVPPNSDISGPGVRGALYAQNILCFIPAVWAIWDGHVSDYELESMETQSTTNLLLAFAILISCIVQALTRGLTNFHASIVLSMSWMNNTNAFVYFLLYIQYKSQAGSGHVEPQWSSWWAHVLVKLRTVFQLPKGLVAGRTASVHDVHVTQPGEQNPEKRDVAMMKGGVKVLFRRFTLVLGSLHLTLMAALGIWLWSNPRLFGTSDSSCAVDYAHVAVLGARVPFGSKALQIFSLVMYGLFILPGLNLLLPMAAFLGLFFWHHSQRRKVRPPIEHSAPEGPGTSFMASQILGSVRRWHAWSIQSAAFPICVGLCLLLVVNVLFIVDIELTLSSNGGIQDSKEGEWGFGQILAMLLVFMPLRDLVEMILARRLKRQELEIKRHEQAAAWSRAILRRDIRTILELVNEGADPSVKTEDGWTALEVAIVEKNVDAVYTLAEATTSRPSPLDVTMLFHDGRTAVEVAALNEDWEIVDFLLGAGADVNAVNRDQRTALEVAALQQKWASVGHLIERKADINLVFGDGRTLLELAVDSGVWNVACYLAKRSANLNVVFKNDTFGSVLQAACASDITEAVNILLKNGADPHFQGGKYGPVFHVACAFSSPDIVNILLEKGVDPNLQGGQYGSALQAVCARDFAVLVNPDDTANQARHEQRRLAIIDILLREGVNLNLRGGVYESALQAACANASSGVVNVLLEKGADPNIQGGKHGSALQAACAHDKLEIVNLLLQKGADPNIQGGRRGTALQAACSRGSPGVVYALLEMGANPNTRGGKHACALQAACARASPEVVNILLEKGADPNLRGGKRGSPLQAACSRSSPEVVQILLNKGANPNIQGGQFGSALQAACAEAPPNVVFQFVSILLENGADPNIQGGLFETALQAACVVASPDVVKLLLKGGADPNTRGGLHGSALQAACTRDQPELVNILLENGADPNHDVEGGSVLQGVCMRGQLDIASILLDNDADPNHQGGSGSVLQQASLYGHIDMVNILLEKGANPNLQGGEHGFPLKAACIGGLPDIVTTLLKGGADPNLRSSCPRSESALHVACARGQKELVQILLEHRADPIIQDSNGRTPLQVLHPWGTESPEIRRLLRQHRAGST